MVLGSTDVPTVAAFMKAFEQQHYNPKIFIAAAGPDQGSAFISAVGASNADGMMVPDGWYRGYDERAEPGDGPGVRRASTAGPRRTINADVAEAYSVGQVVDQAVTHRRRGQHQDHQLPAQRRHAQTVQGPVKFNSLGENLVAAAAFIFQWQNGKFIQVLPAGDPGSVPILDPKPSWAS